MNKDIYIGCYDSYNWDQIKYLVNSLEWSGFTGTKIMVVLNTHLDTVKKLRDHGWIVSSPGTIQGDRVVYDHMGIAPHVSRFYHMWNNLRNIENDDEEANVITTDVRDVVFQTNPSEYMHRELETYGDAKLIVASEGLAYKDEPWGDQNFLQCFGPYIHSIYKDQIIRNVGTFGGHFGIVKDLMLMIFQMSLNRPIPIVDQAVFNFLLYQEPYKTLIRNESPNTRDWAATLGTTMDPTKIDQFRPKLQIAEPIYDKADGTVYHPLINEKYCIVHQYDRVPGLRQLIEEKFK